jgi:glycosyltransferase involved in cell wall biosynthesis
VRRRYGVPRDAVITAPPPVESDVFSPRGTGPDLRSPWGGPAAFVVGIVARVQPHRRFDLLWEVAATVCGAEPGARFVLLGRGDEGDLERLCFEPVERLGLGRNVLFPGYLYGDQYPPALRSLDALLFLVPGSDGTCRAVREAFATGLPVVSTDLGILPELVGCGERGFAVPARAADLAQALLRLAGDRALAARLSAGARCYAVEELSPSLHAGRLLALYRRLLGDGA